MRDARRAVAVPSLPSALPLARCRPPAVADPPLGGRRSPSADRLRRRSRRRSPL